MKLSTMGFTLFISIFFAVGFGLLGWGLFSLFKSRAAQQWPQTTATLTSCELVEDSGSDSTTWQVKVGYTYSVNGIEYAGSRVAFGYNGSSSHHEHQTLHARLRDASQVRVRYNPTKPSESALGAGFNKSTLIILIFASVWLIFVTGFTVLWGMSSAKDTQLLNSIEVLERKP